MRAPIRDGEGRVAGVVLVFRDITRRRQDEQALQASHLNPRSRELLEHTQAELVGRELWQVGLFEDRDACVAAMRQLQSERYVRLEDVPLRTRQGRRIDVEFVSNVFGKAPHEVEQCNIRDITARKSATDELRESSQRKSEFLAMLAHELRNPLAPIRSALETIGHAGGDAATQRSALETLQRQVAHMARMVDDLLDVSRVGRGTIELRHRRVDLAEVLRQAAEVARPLCDRLQHRFTVALPAHPVHVEADPARLAQALGNLLDNACKFTPSPGGQVELTLERDAEHALIRVRDNGVGIAADQMARIFELFLQVDTSLERSTSGLGIRLTLVRTLVELHGGTVQAVSAGVGRGSEFVIRLPALAAVTELDPVATANGVAPVPRRVLVVDDNRDATASLTMLLQLDGHQCAQPMTAWERWPRRRPSTPRSYCSTWDCPN